MGNLSHSFSVEVASKVGVHTAILMQHLWFLQHHINPDNPYEVWVRRSRKALSETYPYMTEKEIRGVLDRMERDGLAYTSVQNEIAYDRTKSYQLTDLSLSILGIDKEANPLDLWANGRVQKGQSNSTKGPMIKVGYNSVINKLVEGEERAEALPAFSEETGLYLFGEKKESENVAPPPPREFSPAPQPVTLHDAVPTPAGPVDITLHDSVRVPAAKAKKQKTVKTVAIPETHQALAPLLSELITKRPYLDKTQEAFDREMTWLFSKPAAFGAEHIQSSLDRSKGVWDSLKFLGCEEAFDKWQKAHSSGPTMPPQQPRYNQPAQPSALPYGIRKL